MASKTVKTTKIGGNVDYAKVADRLTAFREKNPRASIKTDHKINSDGSHTFTAFILSDKADQYSADATGSASYTAEEMKKVKAFEKLETIAVGRALSMLGYLNNGEVASSEEMEEFEQYKAEKLSKAVEETKKKLKATKSMAELKQVFISLPSQLKGNKEVIKLKDHLKEGFNNEQDASN